MRFQNDLDLDLFCTDIVDVDMDALRATPGVNAPLDFLREGSRKRKKSAHTAFVGFVSRNTIM